MSERIRTLLLEANGTHWAAVCVDSIGQGLLGLRTDRMTWSARGRLRKLFGERYADASYMSDWRDAFVRAPQLEVTRCNITNLVEFARHRRSIREFDLVVVLHSAAGDRMGVLGRAAAWFQGRRGKLAMFVGNEYDLMDEKIRFAQDAGADYICTQLPLDAARQLYAGCSATIVAMPHALNPAVYFPRPTEPRTVDVGFVGDLYERLIGDRERTDIVTYFATEGARLGLRCDIRRTRMSREVWAGFLASCHTVVGAESGTYFLQRRGEALACAKRTLRREPSISFADIVTRCFTGVRGAINGKAVSSRHFEPIGTMTCQILVEGRYNGVLKPDQHFISVRRDLSDISEAVRKARDPEHRRAVATAAFEHVMGAHTYDHRVSRLLAVVFGQSSEARDDVAVA